MDLEPKCSQLASLEKAPNSECQRPRRRLVSSAPDAENQSLTDANTSMPLSIEAQKKILNNLAKILRKLPNRRSEDDTNYLKAWDHLVAEAELRIKRSETLKQRSVEQEESCETIHDKSMHLAQLIRTSKSIVVYTGAGISTGLGAEIPDYRGPNGLWTQLKKTGTFSITKVSNLAAARPTYTHMALKRLCDLNIVRHIVSQNCDGLHLRSGVPREILSEIHGNMYIEVCLHCKRVYHRSVDVTERTSRFHHKTGRKCPRCRGSNNELVDTIVLYGERSRHEWPMNWSAASKAAEASDLIICLGTSLKTLRLYDNLWPKSTNGRNSKLAIVNLQYTSKDKSSAIKIAGKCDDVMRHVMKDLGIEVPQYSPQFDPLRILQTPLTQEEKDLVNRVPLFENIKPDAVPKYCTENIVVSPLPNQSETHSLKICIKLNQSTNTPQTFEQASTDNRATTIPGWLGRGISRSSAPSKRRRHGNKGKKRARKESDVAETDSDATTNETASSKSPQLANFDDIVCKSEDLIDCCL